MEPVRGGQEEPARWQDGQRLADDVLERRFLGTFRVDALRDLGQLVRVAQQHERAGTAAHRHDVRQRGLPSFVDEQDVELVLHLLAGEQPRGPSGHVVAARRQAVLDFAVLVGQRHAVGGGCVLAAIALLHDPNGQSGLGRRLRHLVEHVRDRAM